MLGSNAVREASRFRSIIPLIGIVVAGCTDETGLLVRIDVEQPVREGASSVRVHVLDEDGMSLDEIELDLDQLPYTIFFTPEGGDASRTFSVTAELLDRVNPFVSTRARASFVAGETRALPLCLSLPCEDVSCPESGSTCFEGQCVSDLVCHDSTCATRTFALGSEPPCRRDVAPSHPSGARLPREGPQVTMFGSCEIDTSSCTGACGIVDLPGLAPEDESGTTQSLCVMRAGRVELGAGATLRVGGDRPFVILAAESVTIDGILDAAAYGTTPGPGGGGGGGTPQAGDAMVGFGAGPTAGGPGFSVNICCQDGGGGGGGNCGAGGAGGRGAGYDGGAAGLRSSVVPWAEARLLAGSGGGAGGVRRSAERGEFVRGLAGRGGAAGGAVQIVAPEVLVRGSILATGGGGGPGEAGDGDGGAGGGGGSGGVIIIEALVVSLDGATLFADGGGGGGGAGIGPDDHGFGGADGAAADRSTGGCATGGMAFNAANGDGGGVIAPECIDGASGENAPDMMGLTGDNGGGGAGGAGFIRLASRRALAVESFNVVPALGSICTPREERPTLY